MPTTTASQLVVSVHYYDHFFFLCWTKPSRVSWRRTEVSKVCLRVDSPTGRRWHHYSACNLIWANRAPQTDALSYFPGSNGPWRVEYGTRFQRWCRAAAGVKKKRKSLLGGENVTSTGLEDIFYKCQISHPVQSDVYVAVPPTAISFSISLSPVFTRCFELGGDLELSLRRRSTSDKKGRRSRRLSFIDDSCQDVFFFFFRSFVGTKRQRIVHEAVVNYVPRASVQSLSCLHSPRRGLTATIFLL